MSEAQPITTASPLEVAIAALVADGTSRLVENEAGIRDDSDIEHVHHARVGARRLRSNLSTFKRLVDADWRQTIRAELAWIGSLLGEGSDADVLSVWLEAQAADLDPADRSGLLALLDTLADERRLALGALLEGLDGDRYAALIAALVDATTAPPLSIAADGATAGASDDALWAAFVPLIGHEWKRLRRQIAALGAEPDLGALHGARIRAKKLRYALEALEFVDPEHDEGQKEWAGLVALLQDELGELHDTVSREAWLRRVAGGGQAPLVAGQLLERNRVRRAELLASWPRVWKRLRAKHLRAFLSG